MLSNFESYEFRHDSQNATCYDNEDEKSSQSLITSNLEALRWVNHINKYYVQNNSVAGGQCNAGCFKGQVCKQTINIGQFHKKKIFQ